MNDMFQTVPWALVAAHTLYIAAREGVKTFVILYIGTHWVQVQ